MRGERILSHPIQQFSWEAVRAFIAAGVEPGDRVAIWAPNITEMYVRGYLRITDRIKDMYIVGGLNCYPAEVENLMFSSGVFAQVAVIGIPDERMGEVGMAFVVPSPGTGVTPESVIAWCRENMANYKVPRAVAVVDALPVNASGKVTKFELRERAAAVRPL